MNRVRTLDRRSVKGTSKGERRVYGGEIIRHRKDRPKPGGWGRWPLGALTISSMSREIHVGQRICRRGSLGDVLYSILF